MVRGRGVPAPHGSELITDRSELQPREHLPEVVLLTDHDQPPPTTASERAQERRHDSRCSVIGFGHDPTAIEPSHSLEVPGVDGPLPASDPLVATSPPAWSTRSRPALISTRTFSPINRHGTL